jgi:hypothetical protein
MSTVKEVLSTTVKTMLPKALMLKVSGVEVLYDGDGVISMSVNEGVIALN